MAFVKIRGSQIMPGTLDNSHISAGAAIDESKLNINWLNHTAQMLQSKKVVDFVQVNGQTVANGATKIDLTSIIGAATPAALSNDSVEGVISDAPKNRVPFRDAVTGDPVLDADGHEVYGRVTHTPADGETPAKYEVLFFSTDGTTETAYTFAEAGKIDLQYTKRFNLDSVSEMFAANEKFVEGAADATAHQNILQIAKDIYGSSYSLDRDGAANLSRSLVDEVLVQTRGILNNTVRANAIIDEVVLARGVFTDVSGRFADIENRLSQEIIDRGTAVQGVKDDLLSTAAGKGASKVGIEDASGKFSSQNVEGALGELEARLASVEGGAGQSNQEIVDARTSNVTGTFANVDARLEAGEARFEGVKTEVEAARGTDADLKARLDRIEAEAEADEQRDAADSKALADYITANDTRLGAVEGVNTTQNNRLDALEQKNTEQDGEIDALASKDTEQDGRLSAIEAVNTNQNTRLDGIDVKDTEQDNRLTALESQGSGSATDITAIKTELENARGSKSSVDARLDTALNEDGTLKAGKDIHVHKKFVFQAVGGETIVNLPDGQFFQLGDDTLDVYVNGVLQAKGIHYAEVADATETTKGKGVDFSPEVLVAGDVIILKYQVNNEA